MLVIVIAICSTSDTSQALWAYVTRGQTFSELLSLSGRTIAFEYLLQAWRQSPWLGFGFASGTRAWLVSFRYHYHLGIGAAHDALSRVLVDLGALGGGVLFTSLAWSTLRLWRAITVGRPRHGSSAVRAQAIALFCAACIRSVVSEGIADFSAIYLVMLLLVWALSTKQDRARRETYNRYIVEIGRMA